MMKAIFFNQHPLQTYLWRAYLAEASCQFRHQIFVLVTTCILSVSPVTFAQPKIIRYEDSRVSMACTYSIVAYGTDAKQMRQIVDAAFAEVDRIDLLMSHYKKDSPLSQLNREAFQHAVKVEPELFDFLVDSLHYSKSSDGAFDITVGALMKAWGFFRGEGRMPNQKELRDARQKIGYQHLILNAKEKTIRFDRAGIELDLGGIAKGYAIDQAIKILKTHGIERALVSAGGSTIYGLGSPPEKDGWEIEIQDPLDARKIALTVNLKNQALSISGSSEKFFELNGKRYSHIMDPRTGKPVMNIFSVAVITDTGTKGDALDNIFYVQGIRKAKRMLKKYPATQIFFFVPDGRNRWDMLRY
jgi:FAD:protein FMN transferase